MSTESKSALSYFAMPIAATVIGVAASFYLWGPTAALTVFVLAILEISLSMDNAVVNAKILKDWSPFWRRLFLTVGILVAVFGMRLVFPIVIVAIAASLPMLDVITMALNDHERYATELTSVHHLVAGFGGAFLFMIALGFFLDPEKDHHWFEWIEDKLTKMGQIEAVQAAIVLAAILGCSTVMPPEHATGFIFAGVLGIITFVVSKAVGTLAGGGTSKIIQGSIGGFIYIELLDASFSFDGVIGAFALTNYLPMIAMGLGIGALYVREATVYLVDRGTLSEFRYLEHGAFWAILSLAVIMFVSGAGVDIPEYVTGLLSAALILGAVTHSVILNRREAGQ